MKTEPKLQFTIEEMHVDDIEEMTRMRLQSWLDTYPNEEAGVTREWVEARNQEQLSPEKMVARRQQFESGKQAGTAKAWVALDSEGNIIGVTNPLQEEDGRWRLGSLYVDKAWHGRGVGGQLVQTALEWIDDDQDVYLYVVSYNNRARAFYKKWGFEEIPGTETLFANTIPEIMMVRKAKV